MSATNVLWRGIVLFCVSFSFTLAQVTGPVLYPANSNTGNIFISDEYARTLMRFSGGMKSFFCKNCPRDVRIYTPTNNVKMLVSWLDENGNAIRIKEDVLITSFDKTRKISTQAKNYTRHILVDIDLEDRRSETILKVVLGDWERDVRITRDLTKPTFRVIWENEQIQDDRVTMGVLVTFSERVLWNPSVPKCPPLQRIERTGYNLSNMLEASKTCSENLLAKDIREGIEAKGGNVHKLILNDYERIYVRFDTLKNQSADFELTVLKNFTDFSGNPIDQGEWGIYYYRPFPPPRERQARLLGRKIQFPEKTYFSGKAMGTAATVAVAGACTASFVSSAATGGSGSGGSVTMLNNVQKLHMTGMLAATRLPSNYQNFTGEVGWAVLDIKSPWEGSSKKSNATANETTSSGRSLKLVGDALEIQDGEDELAYFKRIMFWVPLLFIIVIIIHSLILFWFVVKQKEVPNLLQAPRIELMLTFFCLPPVSIAAAGLYKSSQWNAILGTWIIIAFPVLFIVWNLFMLWFYVLRLPAHLREVNLIMDIPNKKQKALRRIQSTLSGNSDRRRVRHRFMTTHPSRGTSNVSNLTETEMIRMTIQDSSMSRVIQPAGSFNHIAVVEEQTSYALAEEDKARSCGEIIANIAGMTFLTLILGEHQHEAEWATTKTQGSKFMARYGVLFEEYRGPPIGRRDVSLEIDPNTGVVDRGELVILKERPLLVLPAIGHIGYGIRFSAIRIYRYHIQMVAKLLDITKTILIGCIVAGVGNSEDNMSSILALISITLTLILLFRIAKPFPSRLDMLMLLLAEVADLIVYTCALFMVMGPATTEETNRNIGLALLFSEAFALLATVLEYAVLSLGLSMEAHEEWRNRKQRKFFNLVHKILMSNERYLERKYLDRWMVKTLLRGLYGRIPERHELTWQQALLRNLQYVWSLVVWFLDECTLIYEDGRKKITAPFRYRRQFFSLDTTRRDLGLSVDETKKF